MFEKIREFGVGRWAIGFVHGGLASVMESDHIACDWVMMPKDRWFADPFILDVAEKEILLLVEDYAYATRKGVISLLHIDRTSMSIVSRKVLLELPTHLSFPAIWRKGGHIYVYPESAKSGKLDMYEYDLEKEELTFVKTICDDVVWDSYITEVFGKPLMFTAAKDDYQLDIYQWNAGKERFLPCQILPSEKPNSRLGGAIFEYNGEHYYPAQDCSHGYGSALDIKRIEFDGVECKVHGVKHLVSPHPKYPLGLHTLNVYKDIAVVDVYGYRYRRIGALIALIVKIKKWLRNIVKYGNQ